MEACSNIQCMCSGNYSLGTVRGSKSLLASSEEVLLLMFIMRGKVCIFF